MWLNYLGSSLVTCFFVSRLARLLREQQTQLASAREENLKNEQLIGIGTVAASTVHSLATPLSTLTVLAEDMAASKPVKPELREDLAMMLTQISRCKQIMKDLATLAQGWSQEGPVSVAGLKSELQEHYALTSPGKIPNFEVEEGLAQQRIVSNLLLQHALINLINNALEAESAPANIKFSQNGQLLEIVIENQTSMEAEDVFKRWGKPSISEKQAGLGIGSFLANSTIEKLGGSVQLHAEEGAGKLSRTRITLKVSLPLQNHSLENRE
jgi:two-component system sensor histidine kinase RegB